MNPSSHWLTKRAALTPHRTALWFQDSSWTFAELLKETTNIAGKLQSFSLTDKPVGLLIQNTPKGVILIHALQQLGLTVVMLNHRLKPNEWVFQLQDSKAQFVIAEDKFLIEAEELSKDIRVISMGEIEKSEVTEISSEHERDVCSIMYTSGTTGKPKGVNQTYENHFSSAVGSALNIGLANDDIWLCAVPIFHISGYSILMRSVIYGNGIRLYDKFDEYQIHLDLVEGRGTMISVVSTMLTRLLSVRGEQSYDAGFRCMLLGGGPAASHVVEECFKAGIPVFQTYGMTETASQFATLSPEDSKRKIGSSGKPLFLNEILIVDEEGNPCKKNVPGEILVKGPNVTREYINRKEANEKSFKNGWFHTGDIGFLDEEGFLFVLDRRSDLIISGGENIYPAEIEALLTSHPQIREAAVVAAKDEKWGEAPVAFVVCKSGAHLTEQSVLDFCSERLARYKVPKSVYWMDELPRNASNKLLRRELKQRLSEG